MKLTASRFGFALLKSRHIAPDMVRYTRSGYCTHTPTSYCVNSRIYRRYLFSCTIFHLLPSFLLLFQGAFRTDDTNGLLLKVIETKNINALQYFHLVENKWRMLLSALVSK